MLNRSEQPPKETPLFITMIDHHKNMVEIPYVMENLVTIFKGMGYWVVYLEAEDAEHDES